MSTIPLLIVSILPCLLFMYYIFKRDKYEPEPVGFVLKVMVLGAASCIPAVILETVFGQVPIFQMGGFAGSMIQSFFLISPVEEFCKIMVIFLFVWKNPNFNEENDGIVYAGACAVGFAMFENLFYVFDYGFMTGILRAITAIPLHTLSGVIMGYFIGIAKFKESKGSSMAYVATGFFMAYFFHGIYDTFALNENEIALMIFPVVIVLFFAGFAVFRRGENLSRSRWADKTTGQTPMPSATVAESATVTTEQKETTEIAFDKKVSRWKFVLSSIIYAGVFIFWILLFIGLKNSEDTSDNEAILGGVILTVIPALIGTLLLFSGLNERKRINS